jgi:hypothetical protein
MQSFHRTMLGRQFLQWFFFDRPAEIARAYTEYAKAFGAVFSMIFLLRTLFAPWKSIQDAYPTKGFNLNEILQTLTLNITARAIGFIIRVFAMMTGLLLQVALFAGFSLYVLLWIFFPVVVVLAVPFLFYVSF